MGFAKAKPIFALVGRSRSQYFAQEAPGGGSSESGGGSTTCIFRRRKMQVTPSRSELRRTGQRSRPAELFSGLRQLVDQDIDLVNRGRFGKEVSRLGHQRRRNLAVQMCVATGFAVKRVEDRERRRAFLDGVPGDRAGFERTDPVAGARTAADAVSAVARLSTVATREPPCHAAPDPCEQAARRRLACDLLWLRLWLRRGI